MKSHELHTTFREGLRDALVTFAAEHQSRRPPRLYVIGGLSLSLLAVGSAAAAAAASGLLPLPGGEKTIEISEPFTASGTGTETVKLTDIPDGASKIRVELSCLTAGTFTFPANAGSLTCSASDAAAGGDGAWIDIPVDQVGDEITIETASGARWALTTTYLDASPVPLAVNEKGDTYGIADAPEGEPDLIAVVATNGQQGYVYAEELADADGTNAAKAFDSPEDALAWQAEREGKRFALPVYLSDGTTVIGEFVIANG